MEIARQLVIEQESVTPRLQPPIRIPNQDGVTDTEAGLPPVSFDEPESFRTAGNLREMSARFLITQGKQMRSLELGATANTHLHQVYATATTPQTAATPTAFADNNELARSTSHGHGPVREPFLAMDIDAPGVAPRWIHAGQREVEAGFQDASLGWVSVRAQTDGHGVHASLIPASPDATQALASHLAGLNAHIAREHAHVGPVTISPPDQNGNTHTFGRELAQNDRSDTSSGDQHPKEERRAVLDEKDLRPGSNASATSVTTAADASSTSGSHRVWVVV